MIDFSSKLRAIPETVLSAPGRALLTEIVELNRGWDVDVQELAGEWFLIEKDADGIAQPTPIEIFHLVEETYLFCA